MFRCTIPFRKICYISSDMITALREKDTEMMELYEEIMFRQITHMDVYLITDSMFNQMTSEQEDFIQNSKKVSLCTEL